ncbi:fumarylacetoacetase [Sporichthya brevicatena]|uniref:fumarylacetoacetase n=1 Tax=Sporichthya brevicatena TaxID=171442 RepID=A0ABP3SCE8_9ACTN
MLGVATRSWVPVPEGSDFPLQNLPFGVFSRPGAEPRCGVAIGDFVLDLAPVFGDPAFGEPSLNRFLAAGRDRWDEVRRALTSFLSDPSHAIDVEPHLIPRSAVTLHLPLEVADYVDFYASEHHATNVGRMFRPGGEPLTPNWKHLPIGYHGRAGTVVVSDTDIVRPCGQRRSAEGPPTFGPTQRLDIEAEVGFVVGVGTAMGTRVPVEDFPEHVFGVVLLNDWSARDVQQWEAQPLGPFLGKSFATSISPWVVPLAALEHALVDAPAPDPEPLPYLRTPGPSGLDIALEIEIDGTVVSRPSFADMYWTAPQQLAHLTVNGASLRTGDLFASGTVSGPEREQRGCLLELSWNGTEPIRLADGSSRTFLADGDTVTIRGTAPGADGVRIGFGELRGTVLPASPAGRGTPAR